ncbi:MAG: hypothetical protein ABR567_12605 [Myxococcales bacterium]|nr:hypothetical protein [Myxococcales bacterium]
MIIALLLAAHDPAAIARSLPFAHEAFLELRREAGAIPDPALRAAVETQILTPWLPQEAWAYTHLDEARRLLGEPELTLPPPRKGDFAAAPGGACEESHHGYPGGLAVHSLANLLHARALANVYRHVYKTHVDDTVLTVSSIWHDSLKAATLPWNADGSCGPEPKIAGTPAHHVLGLAAGILRHLPLDLLITIASAHDPQKACDWLQAASIIAKGEKTSCFPPRVEAYITHFADADYELTGLAWKRYVEKAPKGWARFEALAQDGNEIFLFSRSP